MIRPLRQVHRVAAGLMIAVLPASLVFVLSHRAPAAAIAAGTPTAFAVKWVDAAAGSRRLEIDAPLRDLPEVLAYWSPRAAATIDGDAVLLGRLEAATTVLDVPTGVRDGELLFYSPPLTKLVAQFPLPQEPAR